MQASKPTDAVDDGRPYAARRMRSPLLLGMAVSGAVVLAAVIMASDVDPGLDLRLFGLAALAITAVAVLLLVQRYARAAKQMSDGARRGGAGRAARSSDQAAQPRRLPRASRCERQVRQPPEPWRCSTPISITSRKSTMASATAPATSCSKRSRAGSGGDPGGRCARPHRRRRVRGGDERDRASISGPTKSRRR